MKWHEGDQDEGLSHDGESSDSTLSPGEVSDLSMIEDQTFKAIRCAPSSTNLEKHLHSPSDVRYEITSEISAPRPTGKEAFYRPRESEIGYDHNQNLIHLPKRSEIPAVEPISSHSKLFCDFGTERPEVSIRSFSADHRLKVISEGRTDMQRPPAQQVNEGLRASFPESSAAVKPRSVLPKISTAPTERKDTKLPFSPFRQPGLNQPSRILLHVGGQQSNENVGRRKERSSVFSSPNLISQTVPRFNLDEPTRKRSYDSRPPSSCSGNRSGSSRNSTKGEDSASVVSKDPDTKMALSDACTCWRKPLIDQIFITDVTANFVTVTVKECCTDKGFFKRR